MMNNVQTHFRVKATTIKFSHYTSETEKITRQYTIQAIKVANSTYRKFFHRPQSHIHSEYHRLSVFA